MAVTPPPQAIWTFELLGGVDSFRLAKASCPNQVRFRPNKYHVTRTLAQ